MASPLEDVKKFTVGELAALVRNVGGPANVEAINRAGNLSGEIAKLLDGRNTPRTFGCQVDKSDRAFQPFDKGEFANVESGLEPKYDPLKGTGVQDRKFRTINLWERFPDHNPTTQELLDLVKAEGENPDYADTKVFLRDNPTEATNEHPLISLCGSIVGRSGNRYVAYFFAGSDGRRLYWDSIDLQWFRNCRLLVAC